MKHKIDEYCIYDPIPEDYKIRLIHLILDDRHDVYKAEQDIELLSKACEIGITGFQKHYLDIPMEETPYTSIHDMRSAVHMTVLMILKQYPIVYDWYMCSIGK